jgi:hypothetical protein
MKRFDEYIILYEYTRYNKPDVDVNFVVGKNSYFTMSRIVRVFRENKFQYNVKQFIFE